MMHNFVIYLTKRMCFIDWILRSSLMLPVSRAAWIPTQLERAHPYIAATANELYFSWSVHAGHLFLIKCGAAWAFTPLLKRPWHAIWVKTRQINHLEKRPHTSGCTRCLLALWIQYPSPRAQLRGFRATANRQKHLKNYGDGLFWRLLWRCRECF